MRFQPVSLLPLLALLAAAPLSAQVSAEQQLKQLNNRLSAMESQMRAVQRQVFAGGDKRYFQPEIGPASPVGEGAVGADADAAASANLLVNMGQRLTEMEQEQRNLTGRIEELQHQMRQIESRLQQSSGDGLANVPVQPSGLTDPAAEKPPETAGADPAPVVAAAAGAATIEPTDAETVYRQGYALYTEGKYTAAYDALEKFVATHPDHARASNAQFWAGRSLLAQGKTADAAKAFLTGYQKFPQGERAHNSLLWLSRALIDLDQPAAACQSLDQLKTGYPKRLTGQFAADVAATRAKAKCSD